MRKKRLLWQLYPSFLVITLLAILIIVTYGSISIRSFYLKQKADDLVSRAHLIEVRFSRLLTEGDVGAINESCRSLGMASSTRITVIEPSGRVIGDSEEDPEVMDNHGDRPEIINALADGYGMAMRFSFTLQQNMMYVAIPLADSGRVLGVLRTSVSVASVDEALTAINIKIALGSLVVVLLVAVISLIVSRRISRPLEKMRLAAEQFADGQLTHKVTVSGAVEIEGLASALNRMAGQLNDRIDAIVRERNEREAVLASMSEGVVAVDSHERVLSINAAAGDMLDTTPDEARGRMLQEVVRNTALQKFVIGVLSSGKAGEEEIFLTGEQDRHLQASGTILYDAAQEKLGVLLVLNDITHMRRLETVRRDFVANVSHELKTPITSIRGFAETLRDGLPDDPDQSTRFLGNIIRQADRLQEIIDDLLMLSRIEQQADDSQIELSPGSVSEVVTAAVQACAAKAAEKQVQIVFDKTNDVTARINAPLLEQALINLIDNAVKYSDNGGVVSVELNREGAAAAVHIRDRGCGIPQEHLPRLFERFYRVEKSRNRKMGGTGLGLSIVKHIVKAHDGRVTVTSRIGEGSTFSVYLAVA